MHNPIERRAGLADRIADELDRPGRQAEPIKLNVKAGADIAFAGWEIADYSTNADRARWAELKLWLTVDGNAIAGRGWHSNVAGETTFWTAAQVATVEDAMNVWEWDTVAKAFARKLKFDVVRRVP